MKLLLDIIQINMPTKMHLIPLLLTPGIERISIFISNRKITFRKNP